MLGPSFAHLLSHDLRLAWRDVRAAFRMFNTTGFVGFICVVVLAMHGAAWPAVYWLNGLAEDKGAGLSTLALGVLFVMLLMTAQSLNGVTRALYGRGDLDLLFSSPVSARELLLVRALAIACGAGASAAMFVVPLADVGLISGDLHWLALYPALVAGALTATTLGLLLAVGMITLIGPKRARLGAQILATFIGAGFMLAAQLHRFVPESGFDANAAGWGHWLRDHAWLFNLPVRAAAGEPYALILWCLISVLLFGSVTLALGPRFLDQAMAASTAETASHVRVRRSQGRDRPFQTRLGGTLRRKEWRIILRDPWIVSQILLQLLYISPLFVMLWHGGSTNGSPVLALAPTIVVVCYQLSASLTWLSLSGEDAPELLQTAPIPPTIMRRGKLQAVAGLTMIVITLPFLWLLWLSPLTAFGTLGLACFAGAMAVLLNIWHSRPARRASFAARHRESKILALIEMVIVILLGISTALVVVRSPWGAVPLAMVGAIVLCNRPRRRLAR